MITTEIFCAWLIDKTVIGQMGQLIILSTSICDTVCSIGSYDSRSTTVHSALTSYLIKIIYHLLKDFTHLVEFFSDTLSLTLHTIFQFQIFLNTHNFQSHSNSLELKRITMCQFQHRSRMWRVSIASG